jgi:hypothetical protein
VLEGTRLAEQPMESFDQSLKYLLQHDPAGFIGFGLGDVRVRVLEPVPSVLPSRGRDIDGAYVIAPGDASEDAEIPDEDKRLAHVELHRRHQSIKELGIDVAEAQVRLFRREGRLVVSHVWDLYGDADAPVREERRLTFGAQGSTCIYQRINLRGMNSEELLAQAPPALWALCALTRDGAAEPVVAKAWDAIDARTAWTPGERADHLAVLWFVAEAEGVPGRLMQAAVAKERLMESELYKEIFGDGRVRGNAEGKAESILAVLAARDIPVSDGVRARVLGCSDVATLDAWIRRAAVASTALAVVRAKPPARAREAGVAQHASKA